MNSIKYRKWYLQENWGENKFKMIQEFVNIPRCLRYPYSINFQRVHPKVESGEAFWITHNKLCIGYYSIANPYIFRPIFSHKRQRLLDKVHNGKEKDDEGYDEEENYSINNAHLGYARKKYLVGLIEFELMQLKKKIPMDCVNIILSFINQYL